MKNCCGLILTLISFCGLFVMTHQSSEFMLNMLEKKVNTDCLRENNVSLKATAEKMQTCVDDVVRPLFKSALNGEDYINLLIDQMCRKVDLLICLIRAKEEVEECLSKDRKDYFFHIMRSAAAGINYACRKNAYHFTEFFRRDGKKCFMNIQPGLNKCFKQRRKNNLSYKHVDEPFSEENCLNQEQFFNCFVAVVEKECEDKSGSHFFYGFFYTMLRATPCVDYVKSNAVTFSFNSMFISILLTTTQIFRILT